MKHNALFSLALLAAPFCTALAPNSAAAQVVPDNVATVEVLPGWRQNSGTHMAALKITLASGWHTYWRAPGAAGIPPSFDWSGSDAQQAVQFHWPVPQPYEQNGLRYTGYENELILPFEVTPNMAGDFALQGEIHMGVCEEVCLPLSVKFDATLFESATRTDAQIKRALASKPKRASGATCTAKPIQDGMSIQVSVRVPDLGPLETAVIEHPDPSVWVSEAHTSRDGDTLYFESEMVPSNAAPFFVDRSKLTLTVIGEKNGQPVAYEAKGCTGG
jgi:DsbC/DsbD-like thiol-disulfide interchange protein